jgi:hypothetical protein
MLSKLFIAWCLMALCVTIHAIGLTAAFRWMKRRSATIEGRFWPGAVVMMLIASLVTNSGRSAWFVGVVGVLVLMVYLIFALTLYMLPPGAR